MPILGRETDVYPEDLLDNAEILRDPDRKWWCLYTISRREKDLMRKLKAQNIPFCGPTIARRYRSPQGRMRTSYVPLFPNYVFLFGDDGDRYQAMTTNCISRCNQVLQADELVIDLRQVVEAVRSNVPLTPEAKLEPGQGVRVRAGHFRGYEGMVVRREGKTRLLLSVRFLEQGVSMEIDEGLLEPL